jgi:hypothetical protein
VTEDPAIPKAQDMDMLRQTVLAFLVAGMLVSGPGPARADGTVTLKGSVVTDCAVYVTDLNATLDLVAGSSNVQVATVGEKCNSSKGFTVTLTSLYAGVLKTATGAQAGYTVSYDTAAGVSLATPLVLTRRKSKSLTNRPLKVSVPANARALAGSYYDTITLTIAAR